MLPLVKCDQMQPYCMGKYLINAALLSSTV